MYYCSKNDSVDEFSFYPRDLEEEYYPSAKEIRMYERGMRDCFLWWFLKGIFKFIFHTVLLGMIFTVLSCVFVTFSSGSGKHNH